jgi:hypothetical protein
LVEGPLWRFPRLNSASSFAFLLPILPVQWSFQRLHFHLVVQPFVISLRLRGSHLKRVTKPCRFRFFTNNKKSWRAKKFLEEFPLEVGLLCVKSHLFSTIWCEKSRRGGVTEGQSGVLEIRESLEAAGVHGWPLLLHALGAVPATHGGIDGFYYDITLCPFPPRQVWNVETGCDGPAAVAPQTTQLLQVTASPTRRRGGTVRRLGSPLQSSTRACGMGAAARPSGERRGAAPWPRKRCHAIGCELSKRSPAPATQGVGPALVAAQ